MIRSHFLGNLGLVTVFIGFLCSIYGEEAKLDVMEIVKKANIAAYYGGKDGKSKVKMTIFDANGQSRTREFIILRWNKEEGGEQKFYLYFTAPNDVYKMSYLVHKRVAPGQEDDRWIYLPAMNLVKRIAPGDKRTSFVGSDFVYEDVSGRNIYLDDHSLLEETNEHYMIKSVPKQGENVEFRYYLTWIDKKTFMPIKAEYYDKNEKKYRVAEALSIETIQDIPTVTKAKMADLNRNTYTINEFSQIKYNINLDEKIFTERFLQRPPKEIRD